MNKFTVIRNSCSCGHDEFDIKGGGDCPECGKDLNNCVWSDDQAITYFLEEQSINELSSVTANDSPVLQISSETHSGGSWQWYIHWDTNLHPDKTRVLELQRRVSLGLDIFTGEEIYMSNTTRNITLLYPPSVNSYWRSIGRGRVIISSKGRLYRESVIQDVSDLDLPILHGRLKVTIQAWMPDKRRRDVDNITKALLDALAHAKVYQDDEQIDDLRIIRMGIEKPGRVDIEIEEIDGTVRKT